MAPRTINRALGYRRSKTNQYTVLIIETLQIRLERALNDVA